MPLAGTAASKLRRPGALDLRGRHGHAVALLEDGVPTGRDRLAVEMIRAGKAGGGYARFDLQDIGAYYRALEAAASRKRQMEKDK